MEKKMSTPKYTYRYKCINCKHYLTKIEINFNGGICCYCGYKSLYPVAADTTREVGHWEMKKVGTVWFIFPTFERTWVPKKSPENPRNKIKPSG